jgi:hypothetical protein
MLRFDKLPGQAFLTAAAGLAFILMVTPAVRAQTPDSPTCNCPPYPVRTVHRAVVHHTWHRRYQEDEWDGWAQGQVRWGWSAEYDARYGDRPVRYPAPAYVSHW